MKELTVVAHPLIQHHLARLRNAGIGETEFRHRLALVCKLMTFEVTKGLPTKPTEVETPLETTNCDELGCDLVFVSILRAGLGMQDAFLHLAPESKVGHIGLYRNEETLEPVFYYSKLPQNLSNSVTILLDPMLATGGSLAAAVALLKENHARHIKCVTLVSAPEGVQTLAKSHPDVEIFTAALDRTLNENGYILPGLGDAGDRQFRT